VYLQKGVSYNCLGRDLPVRLGYFRNSAAPPTEGCVTLSSPRRRGSQTIDQLKQSHEPLCPGEKGIRTPRYPDTDTFAEFNWCDKWQVRKQWPYEETERTYMANCEWQEYTRRNVRSLLGVLYRLTTKNSIFKLI